MNKKTVSLICCLPLLAIVCQLFWTPLTDYKFWSGTLAIAGYTAVSLLVISLSLAPLAKHFPTIPFFPSIRRYKKETGVACFFYVLIHVFAYIAKKLIKQGVFPWKVLLHPVIIPAEIAFIILLLMTLTSNRFSVEKLNRVRWKRLHRFVYLAEAAVFTHLLLQGGIKTFWAFALFIPLTFVQLYRRKRVS